MNVFAQRPACHRARIFESRHARPNRYSLRKRQGDSVALVNKVAKTSDLPQEAGKTTPAQPLRGLPKPTPAWLTYDGASDSAFASSKADEPPTANTPKPSLRGLCERRVKIKMKTLNMR